MPRLMADAANPYNIPAGQFPIVAGYVDGAYKWSDAAWKYHDASLHLTITCTDADVSALCADIEDGCLSPNRAGQWAGQRHAQGLFSLAYLRLSFFDQVHAAMQAFGVPDFAWGVWYADWDNQRVIQPGAYGHQFADGAMLGTGYDLSVMADYIPGLDPLPAPVVSGGAVGSIAGWSGLAGKIDSDLPLFGSELGVLASGLQVLG